MEKVIRLVSSPLTASIETFDDLTLQLFQPSNDKVVTLNFNPNLTEFKTDFPTAPSGGTQIRGLFRASGPPQVYTFDFGEHNTLVLSIKPEKKRYGLKLLRIEPVEGQKFYSYEFLVTLLPDDHQ